MTVKPYFTKSFVHITDYRVVMDTKIQLSWDLYEATDRMWWYNYLEYITTEKYDSNGKVGTSNW